MVAQTAEGKDAGSTPGCLDLRLLLPPGSTPFARSWERRGSGGGSSVQEARQRLAGKEEGHADLGGSAQRGPVLLPPIVPRRSAPE